MSILFVFFVCAAVAGPFIAMSWALRRLTCPNCGASVAPDPALVRMMTGE